MTDKLVIEALVKAIKDNELTLEQVPDKYKVEVEKLLKQ